MQLDDLPSRFADALESAAARARALTADRLNNWIRLALLLAVVITLTLIGLVLALVASHRALAVWLGSAGASTTLGGLFLVAGLLIWNRGTASPPGGK